MVGIIDFEVSETAIAGLYVATVKQATDERGTVREFFRTSAFQAAGLVDGPWVQLNVTETGHGAVRGMHGEDMVKLTSVAHGEVFGAWLDAREESPSYGAVVTEQLVPGRQMLVPAGVCNGFQSVSPGVSQYVYAFTAEWTPQMAGRAFSPLDSGIDWPLPIDVDDPAQISVKDRDAPPFPATAP